MADTCLVTGGAGFIGSHLVRALVERGDDVRVIDDLSSGFRENLDAVADDIDLVEASILDADALARAAEGCRFVFHLAAQVSVPASMEDPAGTHEVNATGSLRVFEAARAAGVDRVVMASSCAVYGDEPSMPKREDSPVVPTSPYAATKYLGEIYGETWTRGLGQEVVALRFFNVFGARQNPEGGYAAAIPVFTTRALQGRGVTIYGDGEQTRDFVYVDNVVEALTKAAEAPDAAGRVFNVGSGESISINRLVRTLGEALGRDLEAEHGPERAGDIRHSRADVSRAREVLGYRGDVSLREGLERTVAWYREAT
ncbi:MAG: SDR family oxidoreductase [Myxococcota bacterium]